MVFTTIKRITKTGFVSFWRNGFLSFAAIVVITLALCAFGALIFGNVSSQAMIVEVKDKVDINVYFTLTAMESDILSLQKDVNALPEVASSTYISRDQVLETFKTKWQDNALIMQGLDEVGSNPFPATLNIKAKDPGQYGNIANFLENKNSIGADGNPIIDKVNYEQNKLIIDRLNTIIPFVEGTGSVIAIILILVAIIVVFNTIRLIVFTMKDEISVMKLVGASNIYVRGPLVTSGIMYGIVSALITLTLMWFFAYWSDTLILRIAGVQVASDFSLLVNVFSDYFNKNIVQIFALIMGTGILLGGLSSYIAAKRYLKV